MTRKSQFLYGSLVVLMILVSGCSQQKATTKSVSEPKIEHKETAESKAKSELKSETILNDLKNSKKKSLVYYALGDSLSVGLFSDSMSRRFTSIFTRDLQKGTGK